MELPKDKINKVKETIHLSDQERDLMDDVVLKYMDKNPLIEKNNMKDSIKSGSSNFNPFVVWGRRLAYVVLILVVLFSLGGGTALAAKNALPGEALYFFKVNVTEEIKSALISSVEEKADWEAERLELRLDEITKLVEKTGNISQALLQNTQKEIKEQTVKVAEAANNLEVLGEHEAIYALLDRIQSSLETYNKVLGSLLTDNVGITSNEVDKIIEEVEETEQAVKEVQFKVVPVEEETVGDEIDGSSIFKFLSIKGGEVLMMDELYPVRWSSKIDNETHLTIQLLDINDDEVGEVSSLTKRGIDYARKPDRVSDLKWNPKYVYSEHLGYSVKVSAGQYRLKMLAQTTDEKTYYILSDLFTITSKTQSQTQSESVEQNTTADETGLPDLAVKNMKLSPTQPKIGDTVEVSYEMVNIGQVNYFAKHTFSMSVKLGDQIIYPNIHDGDDSCAYNSQGIATGEVCSVKRSFVVTKAGDYAIKVYMPYVNTPESSLENNSKTVYFTVGEELPDMEVKDITFDPAEPVIGSPVEIVYLVENITDVRYFAKHTFALEISLNGEVYYNSTNPIADSCAYDEQGTDPGKICTVKYSFTPVQAGKYQVKAYMKNYHTPEVSQENNSVIAYLEVGEQLPDLAVKNIDFSDNPIVGNPVEISYQVENISDVVYFAKHSFGMDVYLDGETIFSDAILEDDSCNYNGQGIAAGEVCSVKGTFTPPTPGLYTIKVYSAYKDYVPEESEYNNTGSINLEIN